MWKWDLAHPTQILRGMSLELETGAVVKLTTGQVALVVSIYTMAGIGVFYDVLLDDEGTLLVDESNIERVL